MMSRITGFLICLAMAFVFLPMVNAKADDVVAKLYSGPDTQVGAAEGYTSLQAAFTATESLNAYTIVMLQKDVTVNEALTLNQNINLFLNGYTLTFGQGASLTGTVGVSQPVIDIFSDFESKKGGSFISSGNLEAYLEIYTKDVNFSVNAGKIMNIMLYEGTVNFSGGEIDFIQTWGTVNMTGGKVNFFGPENGTATITGGSIGSIDLMNNDGSPVLDIKGDVNITEELLIELYGGDANSGKAAITISGAPKIAKVGFSIEDKTVEGNWGSLTIKGGYFGNNPVEIVNGMDSSKKSRLTLTAEGMEQYGNQSDWAADTSIYKWRIVDSSYSADVAVTGVSLNKTTLSLAKGASETLTATVAPANATNKTVTWTSDNTAVATVANGKVTAVAAGKAKITAKAGDKTAVCEVTVTEASSGSGSGTQDGKDQGQNPTTGTVTAKKANTLTAKGKTISLKAKDVKKKNKKFKASKAYTVKNAEGTLSYKLKTAKNTKDKKNYKKKFAVDSKSGQITVKKGLKKGTYKLTITVTAAGNDGFKKGSKTATVTVKVK